MNVAELMLVWAKDFCETHIEKVYQEVRSEVDRRAQEGWLYAYIDDDLLSPLHPVGVHVAKKLSDDGFLTDASTGDKYTAANMKIMWSPVAIKMKAEDEAGLLTDEQFLAKYKEIQEGQGDYLLC